MIDDQNRWGDEQRPTIDEQEPTFDDQIPSRIKTRPVHESVQQMQPIFSRFGYQCIGNGS
ncbi:hypothetical protein [Salisediminibacterium beveridgei]|uniref:Uncharacterized protein n=1 Tax=Salisediminibacterium beveridgei TaxID=632773 RepID=A0A1D7QX42_9BACI|nr:hypothetical protein [Salisediminibacterium beveridgei]AOM83581.1 hypothetical protein BBEV_2223 [Salisediminibacterium beveridgei]